MLFRHGHTTTCNLQHATCNNDNNMILLTGATGLLGGHTLYALLQKHERVAALKREHSSVEGLREIFSFYTDHPDSLMERIEWRTGDMLDADSLVRAMDGITCVINCAAIVSFDPKDRNMLIRNNVIGTKNLVHAMMDKTRDKRQETRDKRQETGDGRQETGDGREADMTSGLWSLDFCLIHVSSTSALGDSPGNDVKFLIDEETPRDLNRRHNGYSESKYGSEQIVWNAIEGHEGIRASGLKELPLAPGAERRVERGLGGEADSASRITHHASRFPAIILNPGIILGPGQWTKGSSQLFRQAWEGLKYYPYGGTGYVDVRDVAEIIREMVEEVEEVEEVENCKPKLINSSTSQLLGQRFCVVGANLRYKEFFDKVTDEFGKPNPYIYAGKFLSGLAWRADTLKARLTGRYPLLTRDTAESAQRISFYSSEKIQQALDFKFRPIEETLDWVCSLYQTKDQRQETRGGRQETEDKRQE